jgi:23S rRNA pseudouridine2605 synthase
MDTGERLQKIIASAGIASRRQAEKLIESGRVTVNGQVVTRLGAKADLERDHVKVDGKMIHVPQQKTYLLLNKPKGVISTVDDPLGRVKVTDYVKNKGKLFPVGRLDFNTEGIILLTNDGEFSRIVAEAGERFAKVYEVKVRGIPEEPLLQRLRNGQRLPDGTRLAPCRIRVMREAKHAWLEVTLTEGKNREIRKMFDAIGHSVTKLRRTRIGFFTDEGLPVGASRPLTPREIARVLTRGKGAVGKKIQAAAEPRVRRGKRTREEAVEGTQEQGEGGGTAVEE